MLRRRARRRECEPDPTRDARPPPKQGPPSAPSGSGERFTLIRPRTRRASSVVDAPSFAGGGAAGRLRHLLDSALRLCRDRTVVILFVTLASLYQLRMLFVAMRDTAGTIANALVAHEERALGPVSLVTDLLVAYVPVDGRFGGALAALSRHKRGLDRLLRTALPGVVQGIVDFVAAYMRDAVK